MCGRRVVLTPPASRPLTSLTPDPVAVKPLWEVLLSAQQRGHAIGFETARHHVDPAVVIRDARRFSIVESAVV